MTGGSRHHRRELGGICTARAQDITRMELVVKLAGLDVIGRIRILGARSVDQMVHDPILREIFQAVGEVFPQQEFRE